MMHLILAESELELTPWNKKELLDSSIHHRMMKKKGMDGRRGRPDIAHFFLVVAMESLLNKAGMLRVYIHTRGNEVIYIAPETRIIKNYNRFKGLIAQLFERKRVPFEKPLLTLKKKGLKELIEELQGKKILFTRRGRMVSIKNLHEIMEEDVICIIGGFPSGYFLTDGLDAIVDDIVSIHNEMLPAWIVTMEAIASYERFKFK